MEVRRVHVTKGLWEHGYWITTEMNVILRREESITRHFSHCHQLRQWIYILIVHEAHGIWTLRIVVQ
jgi:hypothetical protein